MLIAALVCFVLAILLGLTLLTYVLQGKNTPKGLVFMHGPLAATGLILLIIYAVMHPSAPLISMTIFMIAALGGLFLFYKDLTGKPLPKWLAVGHGLIALIGFVFLVLFLMKGYI